MAMSELPNSDSQINTRPRFVSAPNYVSPQALLRFHSVEENCRDEPGSALSYGSSNYFMEVDNQPPVGYGDDRWDIFQITSPSTTFLHINDRPSVLPKKDPLEAERHRKEFNKIMVQVMKRQKQEREKKQAKLENKAIEEMHNLERLQFWRSAILPNWSYAYRSKHVYQLWWHGLPSAIRGQVWSLVIGNPLGITKALFDACLARSRQDIKRIDKERLVLEAVSCTFPDNWTSHRFSSRSVSSSSALSTARTGNVEFEESDLKAISPTSPAQFLPLAALCSSMQASRDASLQIIRLDVSRTFPTLGLFQANGGPYYQPLHDLLAAYVAYQPEIGYLQGMSFIAAILLLVMSGDLVQAFTAFAAIMNRPSFHAFYSLDEAEFTAYFSTFDRLLANRLPRLAAHFTTFKLECRLYLFDWLFTVYSRSLPLEANLRVWDLFFRDGESALFLAALGIMQMYEEKLLKYDFDQLASFLTGPMPTDMCPNTLASMMRSFGLRKRNIRALLKSARTEAQASLNMSKNNYRGSTEEAPGKQEQTETISAEFKSSFPVESPALSISRSHSSSSSSSFELNGALADDVGETDGSFINSWNTSDLVSSGVTINDGADSDLHEDSMGDKLPNDSLQNGGKTSLLTRLMLLPRQASMEFWVSEVSTDFPRRDALLPEGDSSQFLFNH